ncbi:MAG: hypothetical protein DMG53_19825 [Acidobacteria bacterium]|nr:MAG: hypothetical protein DMG53_19825 [Acidobacteriota bacterium]
MAARGFITPMSTRFKELPPFQAWEEAEMRSVAFGVPGFLVVGAFQAVGAIPTIYRTTLAPVSGMVSAFLIALTLSLAYYHKRWMGGMGGAALFLILPRVANLLYQNLRSLSDVSDDCGGPARNMRPSGHTSKDFRDAVGRSCG